MSSVGAGEAEGFGAVALVDSVEGVGEVLAVVLMLKKQAGGALVWGEARHGDTDFARGADGSELVH